MAATILKYHTIKVALDLTVKTHNEYLRLLKFASYSRTFTHIKV